MSKPYPEVDLLSLILSLEKRVLDLEKKSSKK